eukprot:PhF_6_TR39704/c0_g1_i1/m.59043
MSRREAIERFRFRYLKTTVAEPKKSYEYRWLLRYARMHPAMRHYRVRDELARTNPGVVGLSIAMQASYLRAYRSEPKNVVRDALVSMIPVLDYKITNDKQHLRSDTDPEEYLPEDQPRTLNEVKQKMFERTEDFSSNHKIKVVDKKSQARLRYRIKMRLIKFHRKVAMFNAAASKSVLYSSQDALAYFLYRSPAMYAAVYRVLYEVSTMMPFFVPKSMLDFGCGTGTALMAAKEIYNPQGMMRPSTGMKHLRRTFVHNLQRRQHAMAVLADELKELDHENAERRRKRFMAVVGLIYNGEIELDDIPQDLRHEIMRVGLDAVRTARAQGRAMDVLWDEEKDTMIQELEKNLQQKSEELKAQEAQSAANNNGEDGNSTKNVHWGDDTETTEKSNDNSELNDNTKTPKTWWERLVEAQEAQEAKRVKVEDRLRPLQQVTAIEPSQGMMECAMVVLAEEFPTVHWRRYLSPEDTDGPSDLVIAAYTFSEIATPKARREALYQLWERTGQVLVIIESANIPSFDVMMELRNAMLELKGVGLWDKQPTIVGPCPHEKRCPMQHCALGVRKREMRVCHSTIAYDLGFVEKWAHSTQLKRGKEHFSYLVFARNEAIPERAERRKKEIEEEEKSKSQRRAEKQAELKKVEDALRPVSERVSEEVVVDDSAPPKSVSSIEKPPEWVELREGRFAKYAIPKELPFPTHKYNRQPTVDSVYRNQRLVTTTEMLTLREEIDDYRRYYYNQLHKYYRLVSEPQQRGHIWANFCTPEGEMIRGKVYRRFYIPSTHAPAKYRNKPPTVERWQAQSGWALLKYSFRGNLFPYDVPLYSVFKYHMLDYPNTLIDNKRNSVEDTAMKLGTPRKIVPQGGEIAQDEEPSTFVNYVREEEDHMNKKIQETFIPKEFNGGGDAAVPTPYSWEDRTISSVEWNRVVKGARKNMRRKMESKKLLQVKKNLKDPKKPSYVP